MNLLIDTNILVDVLRKRDEDYEASRLLLALGKLHEFELWISPSQLGDSSYVLTGGGKRHLAAPVSEELRSLHDFITVCAFGDAEAAAAIDSGWSDLEDALVYQAARSIRADCIITRNQRDFADSNIPAKSSSEFFSWLAETQNVKYSEIEYPAN